MADIKISLMNARGCHKHTTKQIVLLDTGSNVHFSSLALTVDLDRAGDLKEDWPIDVIRSVNLFIVKDFESLI